MSPELQAELQPLLFNAIVRIAGAFALLVVGRTLAGLARRYTRVVLKRTHLTASMIEISERSAYYGTLFLAVFLALIVLGIPAEVLITVVGVVAIVAAVALRESLRDLAATLIFAIFQPFKPGDMIETNGVTGRVQEILLFNSVIITLDHRKLIIPNGNIQNTNLINYSALENVRLDLPVSLSYASDVSKAKGTLYEIAAADPRVLREPPSVVAVQELGDNGVLLMLRVYSTPDDYWDLRPALTEQVKLEFDRLGLTIPFPQMDLHLDRGTAQKGNIPQQVKASL